MTKSTNITWLDDYERSLDQYQEDIYLRRLNRESDLDATKGMIEDLTEEIKTKKMILDQLEKQLVDDERDFYEEFKNY